MKGYSQLLKPCRKSAAGRHWLYTGTDWLQHALQACESFRTSLRSGCAAFILYLPHSACPSDTPQPSTQRLQGFLEHSRSPRQPENSSQHPALLHGTVQSRPLALPRAPPAPRHALPHTAVSQTAAAGCGAVSLAGHARAKAPGTCRQGWPGTPREAAQRLPAAVGAGWRQGQRVAAGRAIGVRQLPTHAAAATPRRQAWGHAEGGCTAATGRRRRRAAPAAAGRSRACRWRAPAAAWSAGCPGRRTRRSRRTARRTSPRRRQ